MVFNNVLVPFDDSEHAHAALHLAVDLVGSDEGATIHIITVTSNDIMPPSMLSAAGAFGEAPIDYASYETLLSSIAERSNRELHDGVAALLGKDMDGIKAKVVIETRLAPSPVDGITSYAADHRCDLIIMGRRGLGALRGMLGSVSYSVLRSSDIPVLTVK
jgi:nucleotide-binding universal stress UspA family protein